MKKRAFTLLPVALTVLLALSVGFWPQIAFKDSDLIRDTEPWKRIPQKSPLLQQLITDLLSGQPQPWIRSAAPVIHWHPAEKYRASDPLVFFNQAKIYRREVYTWLPFATRELVLIGDANAATVSSLHEPGRTARLFERQSLLDGYAGYELHYDPDTLLPADAPAPLLWRLSLSPLFRDIQTQNPDQIFIPIEYWYHIANNPIPLYFGSHDGDWESFLVVFDVRVTTYVNNHWLNSSTLTAAPVYFNTSSHGNSSWHCREDILMQDGRWQLFSALNTHATYTRPGVHWRVYPDRTGDGLNTQNAWDTRRNVRPAVKEPYYGFSGSWGRTSFIHWMNGPIPPGPEFKYLPRSSDTQTQSDWKSLTARCPQPDQQ